VTNGLGADGEGDGAAAAGSAAGTGAGGDALRNHDDEEGLAWAGGKGAAARRGGCVGVEGNFARTGFSPYISAWIISRNF
jgi:hypothetical protein